MKTSKRIFTAEERDDICRSYRTAKDPEKQILILSELYVCDRKNIEEVLQKANLRTYKSEPTTRSIHSKLVIPERNKRPRRTWTSKDIEELFRLKAQGWTHEALANHFNVTIHSINGQICKHKDTIEPVAAPMQSLSTAEVESLPKACRLFEKPNDSHSDVISSTIALLEKFQKDFCNTSDPNNSLDAYRVGVMIGRFSNEVDNLLRRLREVVK